MAKVAVVEDKKDKKTKSMNWTQVLKNVGIVVLGGVIGNIAGAATASIARAVPLLGGASLTGLGFVLLEKKDDKKWIGYFTIGAGIGMITSPVMQVSASSVKGLGGLDALGADSKEGAMLAIANLANKFYLDKTPLAKYLPNPTMSGFGDTSLTDEEAKRVIDEMVKEEQAKTMRGPEEEGTMGNLASNLLSDYGMRGTLMDDFGDVELGDLDEDFGDLGDLGKRAKAFSLFRKARKKFGENHPKVAAFMKKHPKIAAVGAPIGDVEEMLGLGRSLTQDYNF